MNIWQEEGLKYNSYDFARVMVCHRFDRGGILYRNRYVNPRGRRRLTLSRG